MSNHQITTAEAAELAAGLNQIVRNLWWTWDQEAQEVFEELSPRCWRNLYHNAVAVMHEVSDQELLARLHNPELADQVRYVVQRFKAYMNEPKKWADEHATALAQNPVAYFSAEFGFHETLPIAAGGLGALAADHAKSASDLGLPWLGISLFYREGYFQQAINQDNWQTEYYTHLNPENLPMEPVLDAKGSPIVCAVDIAMTSVFFKAWRVNVGRVPVYLLDTNLPENEQRFQDLTRRVYGGDSTTRIMQEVLLGVGGVKLLRALAIEPATFHMNEGHAAFLVLELIREKLAAGKTFEEAAAATRNSCIFTTHTPVEAGHDRFSPDMMQYVFNRMQRSLNLPWEKLLAMGRVNPNQEDEPFCMTVLALKFSRAANGVSELHGQVSREMWHPLFPDKTVDDVPIGHITNGVHVLSWMKGTVRRFWKRKLGPEWERDINNHEFWARMSDPALISDEELWALRYKLRRELIEFARRQLLFQGHRISQEDFITFDVLLNPDALTIGFARRFATYKRAPLIFQRYDDIVRLVKDRQRPVQFVFAGKAHPRDDEGKRFIQHIIHLSKFSDLKGHLVFIENYDTHVCRQMVSGCDVWLNNPRRPLEASGTSGQKTSCHGGLNMSILDGWWREGFNGSNGFAVGDDSHPDSVEEQDRQDSENLYKVLTEQVIPTFYERDAAGIPRKWLTTVRHAMATLTPDYNTWRMVQEYTRKYYLS